MSSKWRVAVVAAVVAGMLAATSNAGSTGGYAAAATDSTAALSVETARMAESDSKGATSQGMIGQAMELTAENEALALYFNPQTTEIAVKNKKDGTIWFSNPQDREKDGKASGVNKSMLSSQLLINFSDKEKTGEPQQYNSFDQSVQYGQFTQKKLDDGIRITYTIGEKLSGVEQIPPSIGEERFQSLILDKIKDEKRKKDILTRFTFDPERKTYMRRDKALTGFALTRTLETLEEAGYGEEEMNVDREAYGDGGTSRALFVIPVTYRLEGDQFIVNVSTENSEGNDYILQSISVLPFFGAAGMKRQGYMFVPDGSGSIINLNNGKLDAYPYNETIYGTDATRLKEVEVPSGSPTRLPVFGMKQDDAAFVAIIENGDGIGRIEADVSGRTNSYNYVYSTYEITGWEPLELTANWMTRTVPKFQAKPYLGDISVRYGFLQGEDANYSGMASYYRSYLINKHGLEKLKQREQIPFDLELIGGIPTRKFFLGIPYDSYKTLTTFDQAQEILEQLQARGINDIQLRYTGWFNGGVKHEIPVSVSVDSKLGGQRGLAELQEYADGKEIVLFPDVSFLSVLQDGGGFSRTKMASRTMLDDVSAIYPYHLAGYFKKLDVKPFYALSPVKLPSVMDKFLAKYGKLEMKGLSLRDLGDELNSDFNKRQFMNREEAKKTVEAQLAKLGSYSNVMVSGGNAYTLPYVDSVVNAPLENSSYNITDQSVPFYEMVLHGYIDYAGSAVNLADEQSVRYHVLKALETGANLYFTWFYAKSSAVKETELDYLYSADYRNWIEEAKTAYDELNAVQSNLQTQVIKDHQLLETGVYQTTYEDGTAVVVNYNDYTVDVGGIAVEPMGYLTGGESN